MRVDDGVREGDAISPFYDSMIAKLIVRGDDRAQALARLDAALAQTHIVGLTTNVQFLRQVAKSQAFSNALLNTGLKQWVGRVRPEHLEGYTMAGGLSFPSGHSSGSLVAYGMLAWILLHQHPHWPRGLRAALITLAALAVAAVGYSRIGLQVHYLTDVLGGWLSGSIWLLGSIGLVRALERRT